MKTTIVLLLLISSLPAYAQSGNQSTKPEHKFYDTFGKIEAGAAFGLTAYDIAQTCHTLSLPGGHEDFLPTQSCGKIAGILGAEVVGQELLAYAFHKTGHHKLERVARLFTIANNTRGIAYSLQHGAGKL